MRVDWVHLAQAASCEHGNEPWGSIKAGELLAHLRYLHFLKDSFPWSQMFCKLPLWGIALTVA
jgi:hypothetical protein